MVLQQDFKERHAAAFMITKIRSFKRETIFFGEGGGGGAYSWYFTVHVFTYMLAIWAPYLKHCCPPQFQIHGCLKNTSYHMHA